MDIMDRLKGPRRNLPIGIQSFERLRRDGYLYVDKTAFVYELASTGNPYFLSRPRRFGKSLLLSTLEAYFCGKKELFEGLAIEQLETEWNEHAVLHLDLNAEDYSEIEGLRNGLELQLRSWEKVYGTSEEGLSYSGRFMQVIKEAYRQTGRGVVVLIDEYDVPLQKAYMQGYYDKMVLLISNLFGNVLKTNESLAFAVLTGCLRIAKESIFTGLNNFSVYSITDEDFDESFGFTDNEVREILCYYGLEGHFGDVKEWYDGYRF